jgi:PAS domain S-box-containing protein
VWDRQLRNLYANARAQRRVGRSAAGLRGMHLRDIAGKNVFEAHRAHREAVLAGQVQAFEARLDRGEGLRDEFIQLVPLHDKDGRVDSYVAAVQELWDQSSKSAAQRALAASERKFRALADASPLGIFHTDTHGRCSYTNARWQLMFGLSREQSLGEGWISMLHPDDREHVLAEWQRAAAATRDFDMEFRVRRPDASVRVVHARARSVHGEDGALAGFFGTVEDVTEAREAQRRLRDSEDFLDRTGRVAGVGGWELDLVSGTMTWSDQTCRIHDLEPGHRPTFAEAVGYYVAEDRAVIARTLERAIAQDTPIDLELPLTTASGRGIWVRMVGEVSFANGRPLRAFGALQDVTWRHQAERALRDSNRLLTQLYEQTPAMMHSLDVDGHLLSVSDRWLETMGYTREEVIGRHALDFFTEEGRAIRRRDLQQLWATGRHTSGVLQVLRRDGRTLDIVASAIVQYDDEGRTLRALVVTDDVTELLARTAELRRERVQRADVERYAAELDALLAERNEMLNVLAHEVRQPLNNASAALQSASAVLADPRSRDEAVQRLRRAEAVMHTVMSGVDNTLAVAALVGGATSSATVDPDADIDTLLEVAIGDMPPADRERVRIERVSATRTASMDIGLLRLALRNLLANALRHSPRGSPVVVRVSDSDEPLALVIDVIDQGPGIQPDLLPRLFERGTRGRDPRGRASHGLGLYIVRRALELQGGRAELLTTGPTGTTMRLWIAQAGEVSQAGTSGARNQ